MMKWMPFLTALFIPIHPRMSALTLGIWAVAVVAYEVWVRLKPKDSFRQVANKALFSRPTMWFAAGSVLMYFFYGLAVLWSENLDLAGFVMEVKFSMLLVPLLMVHQRWRFGKDWAPLAVNGFLLGLMAFMFWRFGNALVVGDFSSWRYDELAGPFHPTYMGMYLTIAAVLVPVNKLWKMAMMIVGGLFIGLLASKAAWLIAGGVWACAAAISFKSSKRQSMAWVLALSAMGLGAIIGDGGRWSELQTYLISEDAESIKFAGDAPVSGAMAPAQAVRVGSSAGRVQAWQASLEVMGRKPFGVGTGDVTEALAERYRANGADYALEKNMNPHSVWLQIGVSHGWLGLLLLILWWAGTAWAALKNGNLVLLVWSAIWLLNGSIESLLELQQGVVPTIFLTLLFSEDWRPTYRS